MSNERISLAMIDKLDSNTVGQDILRYVTLPDILGQEKDTILYFIGRNLARKIHINQLEDLYYLFYKFNWGKLELIKEKKKQLVLHLMADEIAKRMESPFSIDFHLESGFIAEAIEQITDRATECTEKVNERLYRVEFTVYFIE